MTLHLINPDDKALCAAFAEHVAGWVVLDYQSELGVFGYNPNDDIDGHHQTHFRNWITSADAVLPHLQNQTWQLNGHVKGFGFTVEIWSGGSSWKAHDAKSAAKACVLALLRAHGVHVEFTK